MASTKHKGGDDEDGWALCVFVLASARQHFVLLCSRGGLCASYTLPSRRTHSGPRGSRSGPDRIPTGPVRPIPILRREKNLRDGLSGLDTQIKSLKTIMG